MKHFLSGFCAGFLQSFVASPAEVVKIKLQVGEFIKEPLHIPALIHQNATVGLRVKHERLRESITIIPALWYTTVKDIVTKTFNYMCCS
jgi:hypothetical protein